MSDPRPESVGDGWTFDGRALRPAIIGVIASVLIARVSAAFLRDGLGVADEVFVVWFYAVVFGGMWLTCLSISIRFGTGKPLDDFGWSWRWTDILWGVPLFVLSRFAQLLAALPWTGQLERLRRLTEGLEHVSFATFVIFSLIAVLGAPLFEELVFRGVIQRSLAARVGSGRALVLQAFLFGLYHVTPGLGTTNVPYVFILSAAGLVLGWTARRWERLGPSSATHFLVNATSVLILYSSR